jgi:hypothetical protein
MKGSMGSDHKNHEILAPVVSEETQQNTETAEEFDHRDHTRSKEARTGDLLDLVWRCSWRALLSR